MGTGPDWALEVFGQAGPDIRRRIPELVRAEQIAMADAQEASGHRSLSVFGQFWRGLVEKFEEFGSLPGAALVCPGRAPYRVPVINGVVLFPWRYGDGRQGPVSGVPFATSDARQALFDLGAIPIQGQLDFAAADPDEASADKTLTAIVADATAGGDGAHRKVVVVAVAASTVGIQDITWGEVVLTDGGHLEFLTGESLLEVPARVPVAVSTVEHSFAAGDLPFKGLRLQGHDDATELTNSDA